MCRLSPSSMWLLYCYHYFSPFACSLWNEPRPISTANRLTVWLLINNKSSFLCFYSFHFSLIASKLTIQFQSVEPLDPNWLISKYAQISITQRSLHWPAKNSVIHSRSIQRTVYPVYVLSSSMQNVLCYRTLNLGTNYSLFYGGEKQRNMDETEGGLSSVWGSNGLTTMKNNSFCKMQILQILSRYRI